MKNGCFARKNRNLGLQQHMDDRALSAELNFAGRLPLSLEKGRGEDPRPSIDSARKDLWNAHPDKSRLARLVVHCRDQDFLM